MMFNGGAYHVIVDVNRQGRSHDFQLNIQITLSSIVVGELCISLFYLGFLRQV